MGCKSPAEVEHILHLVRYSTIYGPRGLFLIANEEQMEKFFLI